MLFTLMKTQGEIESAISESMGHFEQEFMGRGPKDVRAHLINDLVVIRLQGVQPPHQRRLVGLSPRLSGCGCLSSSDF